MDEFVISIELAVKPEDLYESWMNSEHHEAFTGAHAEIEPKIGGKYMAWDGYIEGETLELEPNHRIVQSWRTLEFAEDAPDSKIELTIVKTEGGSKLTLLHTGLPPGDGEKYKQGWNDSYFIPMKAYFGGI